MPGQVEIEAKSIKVDKEEIRTKLKSLGAELLFAEKKFARMTFHPAALKAKHSWLRLRDEGDRVTLCYKTMQDKSSITGTSEILITVDSMEQTLSLLKEIGFEPDTYQENLREEWKLGGVILDIDTWPQIDPWLEVEGNSEEEVRITFQKFGLDYSKAYFGSSDVVYKEVYGIDILVMPRLTFDAK